MASGGSRRKRLPRFAPPFDVVSIGPCTLVRGDCREALAWYGMAADTGHVEPVHACVTDPPYELGFMGKSWDSSGVAADPDTWGWVLDVMLPGAHLCAFAGSRTYHRIASAIEDAGAEIRDQLMWLYGSGFPKSLDIAKALDKSEIGIHRGRAGRAGRAGHSLGQEYERSDKGHAISTAARQWEGWGTALKPAHEPIAMARKPFRGAVRDNVLEHGTGAINVDACRVQWQSDADAAAAAAAAAAQRVCRDSPNRERWAGQGSSGYSDPKGSLATWEEKANLGRWPANVITDGSLDVLEHFPPSARDAIRFFYAAKADRAERDLGLRDAAHHSPGKVTGRLDGSAGLRSPRAGAGRTGGGKNIHPTVKPIDLMAWLCRLVTPPGGIVLDPFMGSGSTGIAAVRHGFRFLGIEQSPEYFDIACRRIAHAVEQEERMPRIEREITKAVRAEQLSMFAAAGP